MADFSVPLIPDEVTLVPPKKAAEDAFYATAMSGTSNLVETYDSTKADLEQTGVSEFINSETERWKNETDVGNKEAVIGIINDETIAPELKKAVLRGYALTGTIATSLKDRYIQKTATKDVSITIQDREQQDSIIEDLPARIANNEKDIANKKITDGYNTITDNLKNYFNILDETTSTIASSILFSIPAGWAGIIELIKERDNDAATHLMNEINSHSFTTKDEGAKQAVESIMKVAETLMIPSKEIGSFFQEYQPPENMRVEGGIFGNPAISTTSEIVLNPINLLGIPIKGKGAPGPATIEGEFREIKFPQIEVKAPRISPDSPLKITYVANPAQAETLAAQAIVEPTGKLSAALGADKGAIVHDWVLPKIFPDEVVKTHPDLAESIKNLDISTRESFQFLRYDPNIINATKREEEVSQIFQILKESRKPYYHQSSSLINETDEAFEGLAVFGRNKNGGYKRDKDAQQAYVSLSESIATLPEELRGTLSIVEKDGEKFINWKWKKEYNDISSRIFGPESIQTSVLGMDVSALSRSGVGRYVFPTGRFPKWVEEGSLRGIERTAALKEILTKPIRDNISNTKHGRELDFLINKAEEEGIDYFSPAKISGMFPHLSKQQSEDLFATHTYWRRLNQYTHNFMNREQRHKLLQNNMEGMYDKNGNYLGAGSSKISEKELQDISEVWNLDTNAVQDISKGIVTYVDGKTLIDGSVLVRLNEKVTSEGARHHYGLLGEGKLSLLPQEVLTRIPGYSPRKVKDAWYVDIIPISLKVNGKTKSDALGLREYIETKAAAKTELEGNKIKEQLQEKYPNHIINVRPERTDNWGRVLTDHQIHQELLQHSMKRGERLPSLNGPAHLEDRMVSLLNSVNSLSRMGAFRAWDDAFQSSFVKGYAKFTKGEFPQYATDIKPLENMGRALKKEYDTAHALFKYYERLKNLETFGDFVWTKGLHGLADILEKWKVPSSALRGKHENPMMLGKTVATVAYIHLNPIRQWLIQPFQQIEMYMVSPQTAFKSFSNTMAVRMYLGAESQVIKRSGGAEIIKSNAVNLAKQAGEKEFLEIVEAIKKSGMMQSVDMNSIVHGVFKEVDRNLLENVPEKIWKDIEAGIKIIPRAARGIGFDAAELTNRVGNWIQVKELWQIKNPGKNWNTKENIENISAEALKLSGAMNRAAMLPYQEGTLSIAMQFTAIMHKMLLNLIQDNTTILTGAQRARLAAYRFALLGGKYGIPGGAIAYHFIEKSDNDDVKKYAEVLKRGAIDRSANASLAALVEPDTAPDLTIAKITSPYSEGFFPYFEAIWEMSKLFDDKPTGPRYPSFGMISSIGEATEDFKGWFTTRDVNETNYKQAFMEAAETASGFNNYTKGLLMLGMKDKVTKMGNKYGMEFTRQEAFAKMFFGIGTWKEEDLWKLVELEGDIKKQKKEMASGIYKQIRNQLDKRAINNDEKEYAEKVRMIGSFISLLDPTHFSEADKLDVINEIEKLDKYNYTTIKQSILVDHWKYSQEKRTKEWKQVDDILRRSPDAEVQKYIKAIDEGKE